MTDYDSSFLDIRWKYSLEIVLSADDDTECEPEEACGT